MKVVTIMNYPDKKEENAMCAVWMKQTRENFPKGTKIEVFYEGSISNVLKVFAKKYDIELLNKERSIQIDFSSHPDGKKANHNVNFKLFNLCQINEPFIFIDADAFLLTSAEPMLLAAKDKPFIAINHQNIPGQTDHLTEPVLNSGVMIVSDPSIFQWNNFIRILARDQRFVHPGTDQSLVNSLVKMFNYDYTHHIIDFSWNSWSNYTVWENGKAFCRGLETEHEVNINHYWNDRKPWNVDCPIYNKFIEEEYDQVVS